MKKNKYLDAFNEYKKTNDDAVSSAFDEIAKKYKEDFIVQGDLNKSKNNIANEKVRVHGLLKESESSLNIINGLIIPIVALLVTIETLIANKISDEILMFYICAIIIIVFFGLIALVKLELRISYRKNMCFICIDCLKELEDKININLHNSVSEEVAITVEQSKKPIEYKKDYSQTNGNWNVDINVYPLFIAKGIFKAIKYVGSRVKKK
ncbi:hypothetical protein JHL18_00620 [Clostridium sp. YIM B02505]|uniref:Uncharacterized protein n=1 Tax=Clostridium yunnanense TaxID=2800325 RepID=A0ABS1EIG3_9CLOT|nr:hypothetical protein [Clostridium yunnanense]MBK1809151.1 hypothetical protein [Clostridium yunnanense]